jgi:hypothetical protein
MKQITRIKGINGEIQSYTWDDEIVMSHEAIEREILDLIHLARLSIALLNNLISIYSTR